MHPSECPGLAKRRLYCLASDAVVHHINTREFCRNRSINICPRCRLSAMIQTGFNLVFDDDGTAEHPFLALKVADKFTNIESHFA